MLQMESENKEIERGKGGGGRWKGRVEDVACNSIVSVSESKYYPNQIHRTFIQMLSMLNMEHLSKPKVKWQVVMLRNRFDNTM